MTTPPGLGTWKEASERARQFYREATGPNATIKDTTFTKAWKVGADGKGKWEFSCQASRMAPGSKWIRFPRATHLPRPSLRDFHLSERKVFVFKPDVSSVPCPGRRGDDKCRQKCGAKQWKIKSTAFRVVVDVRDCFLLVGDNMECKSCGATIMVWMQDFFKHLPDLDKQEFPARLVENVELNVKAISHAVYDGLLETINHGGRIEAFAKTIRAQHHMRFLDENAQYLSWLLKPEHGPDRPVEEFGVFEYTFGYSGVEVSADLLRVVFRRTGELRVGLQERAMLNLGGRNLALDWCASLGSCLPEREAAMLIVNEDNKIIKALSTMSMDSLEEVSPELQLLNSRLRNLGYEVSMVFCDNPSKMSQKLGEIFGATVLGDIFHAEKLISSTLRSAHSMRAAAVQELSKVFLEIDRQHQQELQAFAVAHPDQAEDPEKWMKSRVQRTTPDPIQQATKLLDWYDTWTHAPDPLTGVELFEAETHKRVLCLYRRILQGSYQDPPSEKNLIFRPLPSTKEQAFPQLRFARGTNRVENANKYTQAALANRVGVDLGHNILHQIAFARNLAAGVTNAGETPVGMADAERIYKMQQLYEAAGLPAFCPQVNFSDRPEGETLWTDFKPAELNSSRNPSERQLIDDEEVRAAFLRQPLQLIPPALQQRFDRAKRHAEQAIHAAAFPATAVATVEPAHASPVRQQTPQICIAAAATPPPALQRDLRSCQSRAPKPEPMGAEAAVVYRRALQRGADVEEAMRVADHEQLTQGWLNFCHASGINTSTGVPMNGRYAASAHPAAVPLTSPAPAPLQPSLLTASAPAPLQPPPLTSSAPAPAQLLASPAPGSHFPRTDAVWGSSTGTESGLPAMELSESDIPISCYERLIKPETSLEKAESQAAFQRLENPQGRLQNVEMDAVFQLFQVQANRRSLPLGYLTNTFMQAARSGCKPSWARALGNRRLSTFEAVYFPLHIEGLEHWMLGKAIPGCKELVIMDSLSLDEQISEVAASVLLLLEEETGESWKFKCMPGTVPQQEDGIQCGVFVMAFALAELQSIQLSKTSFGQSDVGELRNLLRTVLLTGELSLLSKSLSSSNAVPAQGLKRKNAFSLIMPNSGNKRFKLSSKLPGASRVRPIQRPAFLRERQTSSRAIIYKDLTTGPVVLPDELVLFDQLYHSYTRGQKTDWTGMAVCWNAQAMRIAELDGGYRRVKLKTSRHLQLHEKSLVRQVARQQAESQAAILGNQPAQEVPVQIEQRPASETVGQQPKIPGRGRGGAGGTRDCASCTAQAGQSILKRDHCCRCWLMERGKAALVSQKQLDSCLKKKERRQKETNCKPEFQALTSLEACRNFKRRS